MEIRNELKQVLKHLRLFGLLSTLPDRVANHDNVVLVSEDGQVSLAISKDSIAVFGFEPVYD